MIDTSKFSPSDLIAYYGVLVTLGLGVASLGGTIVAIVISAVGNRREGRRDRQQDRDRVDRWLAEFVVAATDYRVACSVWVDERDEIDHEVYEVNRYSGDPDEIKYPAKPNSGPMLARLDAAQLVARGKERIALTRVTTHIQYVRELPVQERSAAVQEAIAAVRDWRSTGGELVHLRGELQGPADTR